MHLYSSVFFLRDLPQELFNEELKQNKKWQRLTSSQHSDISLHQIFIWHEKSQNWVQDRVSHPSIPCRTLATSERTTWIAFPFNTIKRCLHENPPSIPDFTAVNFWLPRFSRRVSEDPTNDIFLEQVNSLMDYIQKYTELKRQLIRKNLHLAEPMFCADSLLLPLVSCSQQ